MPLDPTREDGEAPVHFLDNPVGGPVSAFVSPGIVHFVELIEFVICVISLIKD